MSRPAAASLSRLRKLEQSRRRFAHVERLSDDELMVAIFGYDTPELRAAQALECADPAAFGRMLEDMIEHARTI